jgi:hypothetical protein
LTELALSNMQQLSLSSGRSGSVGTGTGTSPRTSANVMRPQEVTEDGQVELRGRV